MCCCEQPNVNGQPGYRWQPNDPPIVRPVDPPSLADGDVLLYDEPGRCGGMDCHCHHYRVVRNGYGVHLYTQNGNGRMVVPLSTPEAGPRTDGDLLATLAGISSSARFWLLHAIAHAYRQGIEMGTRLTNLLWQA